jgi:hypothetical protein
VDGSYCCQGKSVFRIYVSDANSDANSNADADTNSDPHANAYRYTCTSDIFRSRAIYRSFV